MGGLAYATEHEGVAQIRSALLDKRKGCSRRLRGLQQLLAQGTSEEVTKILVGLSHFSVELTSSTEWQDTVSLRLLVHSALNIDLQKLSEACSMSNCKASAGALDAYRFFVLNLASADVTFIELALASIAKNALTLRRDIREPALKRIHSVITGILIMHSEATFLLAKVVNEKHPHPVRGAEELCSYIRSVLEIALTCESHFLRMSIIATVVEKLVTIDAAVSQVLQENDDNADKMVDVTMTEMQSKSNEQLKSSNENYFTEEALKMDQVLSEVLQYLVKAHADSPENFATRHLDPLLRAFERFVLPVKTSRFAPFALLHALFIAGDKTAEDACERLRQSFFDSSLDPETRCIYLHFSAALVARSSVLSPNFVRSWVMNLARWLNFYIDDQEHQGIEQCVGSVDSDVHKMFYVAVHSMMTTISLRADVFHDSVTHEKDPLARMRLLRIFMSPMNPALVVSRNVLAEFCHVAFVLGGLDLRDMLQENPSQYAPSRTKFGSKNELVLNECLPPLQLPESYKLIQKAYVLKPGEDTCPLRHVKGSGLHQTKMSEVNTAFKIAGQRLSAAPEMSPVILSRS